MGDSKDIHAKHVADGITHDREKNVPLDEIEDVLAGDVSIHDLAERLEKLEEAVRALYVLEGRKPPV